MKMHQSAIFVLVISALTGLSGRNAKGKRSHTRAVNGVDGDVKLNRALWVMAENMLQLAS